MVQVWARYNPRFRLIRSQGARSSPVKNADCFVQCREISPSISSHRHTRMMEVISTAFVKFFLLFFPVSKPCNISVWWWHLSFISCATLRSLSWYKEFRTLIFFPDKNLILERGRRREKRAIQPCGNPPLFQTCSEEKVYFNTGIFYLNFV